MPELNWVPAPRYILRRDRVLRHLRDVPPCRLLDIGCGPGALIYELSKRGFHSFGIDSSSKARELAAHLQSHSLRMTIQAELDPRWAGTFDLLLSFEVIEHISEDVGALREWRRYLKTGGQLILSTPAHQHRWNAADEWAGHVRRYERNQLVQTVEAAGFKVETIECYGFPLANVMEMLRARAYGRVLAAKRARLDTEGLTGESGADRSIDTKFWRLYSGPLPSLIMRTFCLMQRGFLKTDLGNGFIVVAKAA